MKRLITALAPRELGGLVEEAKSRASKRGYTYNPPNFSTYFTVRCPSGVDPGKVAKAMASWPTVQVAYVESGPTRPCQVTPGPNETGYKNQAYLRAAPIGIDAEYAWTVSGGDGGVGPGVAGLQFVDVEEGWNFNHEDLPSNIKLIHGFNRAWFGHGSAVLGIVLAVPNDKGCIGIAPQVATTMVSSIWPTRSARYKDRPNAILAAIKALNFGDVLLLEDQIQAYGYYPWELKGGRGWETYVDLPVEVDEVVFNLIEMATAQGIIVVEAAGNGGLDLDSFTPFYHTRWGQDSGAIMVAAATSAVPHVYQYPSNFGGRVDCYASGDLVYSTGDWDHGTGSADYAWAAAGSTSAASAIIAGAALAVQGVVQAKGIAAGNPNSRLSPSDLRAKLRDPKTGTRSSNYPNDKIGVMPDLKKSSLH